MNVRHLLVPKNKEIVTHTHSVTRQVKGTQEPIKRAPNDQSWNNLTKKAKQC